MKRLLVILLLFPLQAWGVEGPWAVIDSTYTGWHCKELPNKLYDCPTEHSYYLSYNGDNLLDKPFWKEGEADDMADALNEAHERRTHPTQKGYDPMQQPFEIYIDTKTNPCPFCVNTHVNSLPVKGGK